jgi:probable rRNA maturation factor
MRTHGTVFVTNRQRTYNLNIPLLKTVTRTVLDELNATTDSDIGFYFVTSTEMAELNQRFLGHQGSTDVITFDYGDSGRTRSKSTISAGLLHGEIFICPDVAMSQSRQFRTDWREEIARYAIHGILHLAGFDDIGASDRRRMKREESRLLSKLRTKFALSKLAFPARR